MPNATETHLSWWTRVARNRERAQGFVRCRLKTPAKILQLSHKGLAQQKQAGRTRQQSHFTVRSKLQGGYLHRESAQSSPKFHRHPYPPHGFIPVSSLIRYQTQIHAGLAILPSSVKCGMPDTQLVSMLKRSLLQVGSMVSLMQRPEPFAEMFLFCVARLPLACFRYNGDVYRGNHYLWTHTKYRRSASSPPRFRAVS